MDKILDIDKQLFYMINTVGTDPWLDKIFPVITDLHQHMWFMAGCLPLLLILWFYKDRKRALKVLVAMALSIALSDAISYRVIKPMVNRPRPAESGITVQMRTNPHSGKSFPSNHAANNFAGATILSFAYPQLRLAFLGVALIVSISRVYVGVHYPFDILGGAILGALMAHLIWSFLGDRWINGKSRKEKRNAAIENDAMTRQKPRLRRR